MTTTTHIRWEKAAPTTDITMEDPTRRYAHAATVFRPNDQAGTLNQVIVYGGAMLSEGEKADTPLPDVWLMTIVGETTPPSAAATATSSPGGATPTVEWKRLRSFNAPTRGHNKYHTMVAVGADVYVFGNRAMGTLKEERFLQHLFEIQKFRVDVATLSATWEAVKYNAPSMIAGRLGHGTAVLADGRIVCYGGKDVGINSTRYYNDVIVFDPKTLDVTYHPEERDQSASRAYFALAAAGSRLFLNGGCAFAVDGQTMTVMSKSSPLRLLDLTRAVPPRSSRWRDIKFDHVKPINAARLDHSVAWLNGHTLLYLGGTNVSSYTILDPWAFNIQTNSVVNVVMSGSVPTKRANTVLVQVDATTLLCLGGKERIKRREPGPRYGNVHTPGVYVGTISVTDEATSPRPPVTPVGLLKRKRSATDSPEAPQKPLKRLDVTTRPGGGGGVATADGDMKESSEQSAPTVVPRPLDAELLSIQNDDRIVKLQHEVDALRHENAQLRIESHRWQVEASHAKEQQPSTQLHEIKLSIDNVAMMVDEKRRYQSNSQSTVNSSQDSPSDLLVNADGHPLSHAALQVELHRASTRLVAAIRKASESSKMAIKSRKAAEADQDALVAAAEKVADISRAMTRDGANNDSTSSGSATQEDSVL